MLNEILYKINIIMLDIDLYNDEDPQGDSIFPFMTFMGFLLGIVILIVGATLYFSSKHQFNIFFDERDRKDISDKKLKQNIKVGKIAMIAGVIIMAVSFFL